MALTKGGDEAEGLLHQWHELAVGGMQAHLELLAWKHMSFNDASDAANRAYTDAIQRDTSTLASKIDEGFGLAWKGIAYLDKGLSMLPNLGGVQVDTQKLLTSALVTGPVAAFKKAVGGTFGVISPDDANDTVKWTSQTVAQGIMSAIKAHHIDRIQATGEQVGERVYYGRRAESGACNFCLMLAGRGAVYSDSTVRFRSHNNCKCTPVASIGEPYIQSPEESKRLQEWAYDTNSLVKRRAGNEDLVKLGLRRKEVRTVPKYTEVKQADGSVKKVQAGTSSETHYYKTQKANQLEEIVKISKTRGFEDSLATTPKASYFYGISDEEARRTLNQLHNQLEMRDEDGKRLSKVVDMASYKRWAQVMGIYDETLISGVQLSRQRIKNNYVDAQTTYKLARHATLVNGIVIRMHRIQAATNTVEPQPLEFWRTMIKGTQIDTIKEALDAAGIIYK